MKKFITSLMVLVLTATVMFAAPKPKIMVQNVSPYMLANTPVLVPDSCITTGLSSVANGTYVYLSVMNVGDTAAVQTSTWTFNSKPSGSVATLTSIPSLGWYKFLADVKGVYQVKVSITTSTGTKDSTLQVTSSDYVGVGGFDGVPAVYPNCMSCHSSMPEFTAIFDRWKVSKHGTTFKTNIVSGSSGFGTSCFKCHTTGYDNKKYVLNGGFDDKARTLGWVWSNYSPPKAGNWDTIKNRFSSLVPLAGIGCEMCHGAGSEHALGGDTTKIAVDYDAGACSSCHDNPWRYPQVAQWKNSIHNAPVFEGRTVADSLRNKPASDCNMCHDGRNHIDYTKKTVGGANVFTAPALNKGDMTSIGCPTCHDPHGNSNDFSLRNYPADTLQNGYNYAFTTTGKTCMTCHQSRRNNKTYVVVKGSFSSTWGPHENPQGDVLMGQNFATFGFPFISGSHKNNSGACVSCHMAATTDTGTVTRDKVGGHSMNLHDAASNFDLTTGCNGCHPGKASFDDFMAPEDYDGNGIVEAWQKEVAGCLKNLRIALPPAGLDSVNWVFIARDSMNLNLRKAFWNYQLINNDKSLGMHNPFLAIQVLQVSKLYAVGVQQNGTEIPAKFELMQNYPNPFNPTTKISFNLPKAEQVTLKIYDVTGKEIVTLVNTKYSAGKYTTDWMGTDANGKAVSSGVYFYKIVAGNNIQTKRMVLIK
ncbi:MAG: ammonia-forming cytochrome c nitrite reductase subunit c552 [Ignavibacteriota bacterium]